MYLSRVRLNTERRTTQMALASPSKIHGAVERAFTEKQKRNLWRIDPLYEEKYLLIVSEVEPNLTDIVRQYGFEGEEGETRDYTPLIKRAKKDSVWHFRLAANPVRAVKRDEGRGKITAHTSINYQIQWILDKSISSGFEIVNGNVEVVSSGWKSFRKGRSASRVRFKEAVFEGILRVIDEELFQHSLVSGIGRERAYGMGMITIIKGAIDG